MRKAIASVLTVFVLAVGAFFGRQIADWALPPPQPGQFADALYKVAEQTNRKLPTMIDEHTRMDKVTVPSPNVLQNNYTFLNVDTSEEGHFARIEQEVTEMIVKRACSTPSVLRLLDRGLTNVYSYNAADGTFFGSVTVTKSDCVRR